MTMNSKLDDLLNAYPADIVSDFMKLIYLATPELRDTQSQETPEPVSVPGSFFDELNRILAAGEQESQEQFEEPASGAAPDVAIFRRGADLTVQVDLPGVDEDDIAITIQGNQLKIFAQRNELGSDETEVYVDTATRGEVSAVVELPPRKHPMTVQTDLNNGVLTVTAQDALA